MNVKGNKFFTIETESRRQFFQIPKQFMIKTSKYYAMTSDAKLLYGILADRNSLSISNNWVDEESRIYFIATIESLMDLTGWGNQKVTKHLKELRKFELLISVVKGQGNPSWHYLLQIDVENNLENQSYQQKCENHISKNVKITSQEMLNSHANNTNINNTNINNTDIVYLSKSKKKTYCNTTPKETIDRQIENIKNETMSTFSDTSLKKFLNSAEGDDSLVSDTYNSVMEYLASNPNVIIGSIEAFIITSIKNALAETQSNIFKE